MSALEERLHTLSDKFLMELPDRVSSISRLLLRVQGNPLERPVAMELERQLHTLAGTAGTYSFGDIASLAAEGEMVFQQEAGVMDAADLEYLCSIVGELHDALARCRSGRRKET